MGALIAGRTDVPTGSWGHAAAIVVSAWAFSGLAISSALVRPNPVPRLGGYWGRGPGRGTRRSALARIDGVRHSVMVAQPSRMLKVWWNIGR